MAEELNTSTSLSCLSEACRNLDEVRGELSEFGARDTEPHHRICEVLVRHWNTGVFPENRTPGYWGLLSMVRGCGEAAVLLAEATRLLCLAFANVNDDEIEEALAILFAGAGLDIEAVELHV